MRSMTAMTAFPFPDVRTRAHERRKPAEPSSAVIGNDQSRKETKTTIKKYNLNRGNTRGRRPYAWPRQKSCVSQCHECQPVPISTRLPSACLAHMAQCQRRLCGRAMTGSEEIEAAGELIDVVDMPTRGDGRKAGRRACSQNDGKTVRPFRKLFGQAPRQLVGRP